MERGYPQNLIENLLPEIKFREGESKLKTNNKEEKGNIAIRDTIPALSVF